MGTVHDIDSARPHSVAKIKCQSCTHKWVAVYPTATKSIQCPKCKSLLNELGVKVAEAKCDTCGAKFTICPAPEDMSMWKNCLSELCASYDEGRLV